MIDRILRAVGYKQSWHICWVIHLSGAEPSYADGTYTIKPRLTPAGLAELRQKLADDTGQRAGFSVDPEKINIISLTRLPHVTKANTTTAQ